MIREFSSSSAKTTVEPAHKAKRRDGPWTDRPFGVVTVDPITPRRQRFDWYLCFCGDRDEGLKEGELEGVIRMEVRLPL